jgi:hypothetical protein
LSSIVAVLPPLPSWNFNPTQPQFNPIETNSSQFNSVQANATHFFKNALKLILAMKVISETGLNPI